MGKELEQLQLSDKYPIRYSISPVHPAKFKLSMLLALPVLIAIVQVPLVVLLQRETLLLSCPLSLALCGLLLWYFVRLTNTHSERAGRTRLVLTSETIEMSNKLGCRHLDWSKVESVRAVNLSLAKKITITGTDKVTEIVISGFASFDKILKEIKQHVPEHTDVYHLRTNRSQSRWVVSFVLISLSIFAYIADLSKWVWVDIEPMYLVLMVWSASYFLDLWYVDESPRSARTFVYKTLGLAGLVGPVVFGVYLLWTAAQDNFCNILNDSGLWRECVARYDGDHFVLLDDESLLAVIDYDELTIRPINAPVWNRPRKLDIVSYPSVLGVSPSQDYLAAATSRTGITIWRTDTWREIRTISMPEPHSLTGSYRAPYIGWLDDRHYIQSVEDQSAIFDFETNQQVGDSLPGQPIVVSDDGKLLVLRRDVEGGMAIDLFDTESSTSMELYRGPFLMQAGFALSADNSRLAWCSDDGIFVANLQTIKIFEISLQHDTLHCALVFSRANRGDLNHDLYAIYTKDNPSRSLVDHYFLYAVDIRDGAEITKMAEFNNYGSIQKLDVSADNQYLIFSAWNDTYVINNILE